MAVVTSAVIGIAATAATTTMSFAQAGKQKKAQRQAETDADAAMQSARKALDVNFYDKLGIQKEPYELQREALLSQGAQAIQAGVESERGAAATAGRIQMAQQEGQAGIRSAMGQELAGLEKLGAQEESRLRDVGVQLDLEEVAGAQLAAANAEELRAQATQEGMQGVVSLAGQVASTLPLFGKTKTPDSSINDFGSTLSNNQKINLMKKATAGKQPMNLNSLNQPISQPMNFNSLNQPVKPLYQQPFSFNPFGQQYLNKSN